MNEFNSHIIFYRVENTEEVYMRVIFQKKKLTGPSKT